MKKHFLHFAAFSLIAGCLLTMLTGCGATYKQNVSVMMVNAAPDLSNIDYYLQGLPKQKSVPFGYNTSYYPASKEEYVPFEVEIKNSASGATIFDITNANLADNGKYSLFVYGKKENPKYRYFNDKGYQTPTGDKVMIRFIHLSPDVDSVDMYMYDTLNVVSNRVYLGKDTVKGFQDFKEFPVKRNPDTLTVYNRYNYDTLLVQPIKWEKGKQYTIYLKGFNSGNGVRSLGLGVIKNN